MLTDEQVIWLPVLVYKLNGDLHNAHAKCIPKLVADGLPCKYVHIATELQSFPNRCRPVASLVRRGVRSRLEACHTEAVQQPRKHAKCRKIIFWPSFSVISMSSHSNFMFCTALVLLSASAHNTTLSFLLIPALTCSYLPCIYSVTWY